MAHWSAGSRATTSLWSETEHSTSQDGQYVCLHGVQNLNGGESRWVTADIFDTDDQARLIEHWDIIDELVGETLSGNTQIDGPTEPTDLDKTDDDRSVVSARMDSFNSGNDYELFMGRWSRLIAKEFIARSGTSHGLDWLDVGCGTGALLDSVLEFAAPRTVAGVDPSAEFVDALKTRLHSHADIQVAGGKDLPWSDDAFDAVVSGLVLNFIPDPLNAVREWLRVTRPGGSIGAYVWDYADGMEFLRVFWDAVIELDPAATSLDEAVRFPICQPDMLVDLFTKAGLSSVESGDIVVTTVFRDFDDYWTPFTRGQGPAPGYVSSLPPAERVLLKERIRSSMIESADRTVRLSARTWTITGRV